MKKGLGYEKKVIRTLKHWNVELEVPGDFYPSQWIRFTDENGPGFAQPDCFIVWDNLVLLVECKLTQNTEAEFQLRGLYYPLLKHIFQRNIVLVQACKNLRVQPKLRVWHPSELLIKPRIGVHTWHFLG